MGIRFSAVEVEAGWRSWKSGRKPDDDPGASLPWSRGRVRALDVWTRMHAIKGTVPRKKYARAEEALAQARGHKLCTSCAREGRVLVNSHNRTYGLKLRPVCVSTTVPKTSNMRTLISVYLARGHNIGPVRLYPINIII